jgi:nitrogen fixation protein
MLVTLCPIRMNAQLALERRGDTLILNGDRLDLSPLPDGAVLPRAAVASEWIAGDITRQGGRLHVPVLFPIGPDAPDDARFPQPILAIDGPIPLPEAWPAVQEDAP